MGMQQSQAFFKLIINASDSTCLSWRIKDAFA